MVLDFLHKKKIHELGLAHKYFFYLSVNGGKTRYNIELAGIEASQSQDLLSQALYHVTRARRIEEHLAFKRKQEEDRLLREGEKHKSLKKSCCKNVKSTWRKQRILFCGANSVQNNVLKPFEGYNFHRRISKRS